MPDAEKKTPRSIIYGAVVAILAAIAITVGFVLLRGSSDAQASLKKPVEAKTITTVELVEGMPYTILVPENVRKGLRISPAEEVKTAAQSRPMVLPGSTALDPTRLMRVKARFNAEVTEIAQVPYRVDGQTQFRELRSGDRVKKGDVLAIVWSIEVGSKKSDLADAIVQLKLDEDRLQARLELYKSGALPEDTLNQTRRDVVTDQNALDRAERGLRVWNVPEPEIEEVKKEAGLRYLRKNKRDKDKEKLWARSALTAPREGTLVERNVAVGEYVADNTINLFTIADVSTLLVMANPPEDLLPSLLQLDADRLKWTLRTVGTAPITARVDDIGYILDSNQHTAVVKGHIKNPEGRLRAGQFVSATVELPPPPDTVEVPLTALAEDGRQSFVFVQPVASKHEYTMRRVQVTARFEKTAFVSSTLKEGEQRTDEEKELGLQPRQPLKPGERVLASGVLELRAALEDRMSKAQKKEKEAP